MTIYRLPRLAAKRAPVAVPIVDAATWQRAIKADPLLPRSAAQIRGLWRQLTEHRRTGLRFSVPAVARGLLARRHEECAEAPFARLFTALGNPHLRARDRDDIDAMIDADLPAFDQVLETDHFVLRWTNSAAHAADNIADPAIVAETAEYLEAAWQRYVTVFGRAPYPPAGATKIDVNFWDIAGFGVASPPDGPISFNAAAWVAQPGIRRPTSAHELFHKLQYAYGYRTTWNPVAPYKWFSEGSASWAEVFMWQRVSGAYKLTDLFTNPDLNLFDASYSALPFWLFFDTRQRDTADDIPLVGYLERYEASGDEEAALAQAIDDDWPANAVYGQLDHFFALFARERRTGAWRQTPVGAQPYATILGPDGAALAPALTMTTVPLASGDSYSVGGSVSGLGSDYLRFTFAGDTGGRTLTITVTTPAATGYSYYHLWERAGAVRTMTFPFAATGSFTSTKTIDLASEDALVFVVSGRGTGGGYTLSATMS